MSPDPECWLLGEGTLRVLARGCWARVAGHKLCPSRHVERSGDTGRTHYNLYTCTVFAVC